MTLHCFFKGHCFHYTETEIIMGHSTYVVNVGGQNIFQMSNLKVLECLH